MVSPHGCGGGRVLVYPVAPGRVPVRAHPDLHWAFPMINQQFLAHAWADWDYVNREQYLGIRGLRQAKESYQPHHMVEKYVVRGR